MRRKHTLEDKQPQAVGPSDKEAAEAESDDNLGSDQDCEVTEELLDPKLLVGRMERKKTESSPVIAPRKRGMSKSPVRESGK